MLAYSERRIEYSENGFEDDASCLADFDCQFPRVKLGVGSEIHYFYNVLQIAKR